jgi:hypothetical protein
MPDALAAALIDAPSRSDESTAITVSTGCVVTRDAIRSDATSASTCVAKVCAESCRLCAGTGLADAEFCTRSGCTARALVLGASGVTSALAGCVARRVNRWTTEVCISAGVVMVLVRRAGLSPSATSIRVLTATVVSMIAGKIHAVVSPYPIGGHASIFASGGASSRDASSFDRETRVGLRAHDAATFFIRPPQYSPKHVIGRLHGGDAGRPLRVRRRRTCSPSAG